eukprot:CAMPEP_0115878034 /NCGR_PEP_ID=MMETSP0287-20121206/26550_1 /TAXON_ID=412157 /ORGANISM="Chrysochromulina rotalis, Strain UIO044" /LENGTH=106 /DNA_ID=CAMNT_0003333607 /DNA_START=216 /DNA_END=536 /DNA_ORIENTATION=-
MAVKVADVIASEVAHSVTGIGFWPRLVMNEAETLVVESRRADGGAQRSHWQTVLPLLCSEPRRISAGDVLLLNATVILGEAVDQPVQYALEGDIIDSSDSALTRPS